MPAGRTKTVTKKKAVAKTPAAREAAASGTPRSGRKPAAKSQAAKASVGTRIPRWDLTPIYPGFDAAEYLRDRKKLVREITKFGKIANDSKAAGADTTGWLASCIKLYNRCYDLLENLGSFAYTQYSVNTQDRKALTELNGIESDALPLHRTVVEFRNSLASIRSKLPSAIKKNPRLAEYEFFLSEELALQARQMEPALEDLAADLNRAGGDAWSRLQESISSQLFMPWDDGKGKEKGKTVVELRSLAYDPDRSVREKAFRLELDAWKSMETPLAYSLNGVKGVSDTLNVRRGYRSTLERSVFQSRLTNKSINALITTMEESLPIFRNYLKAKAKLLGLKKLAFFDLFAPVGGAVGAKNKQWAFSEAGRFVVDRFSSFSPELGDFAKMAFAEKWIDAEPRKGKVGGAYCTSFPLAGASRVMANFDGSFSGVTTLAHELGHGYHHDVLKKAPAIHRSYPMTLAETASIFSETIVFNSALEDASEKEKISILEVFLQDATQIIVDILSRFKFEQALMDERAKRELAPDEMSALMIQAQKDTYGDGLDPKNLHPYMWAVKGHYYSPDLAFYNFPYAFGELFGLGLYNLYRKEPHGFAKRYRNLLTMTGRASARDVTLSAGFDIEKQSSWREGIEVIRGRVEEFKGLVDGMTRKK